MSVSKSMEILPSCKNRSRVIESFFDEHISGWGFTANWTNHIDGSRSNPEWYNVDTDTANDIMEIGHVYIETPPDNSEIIKVELGFNWTVMEPYGEQADCWARPCFDSVDGVEVLYDDILENNYYYDTERQEDWMDITDDPSGPGTWDWDDIRTLTLKLRAVGPDGSGYLALFGCFVKITYLYGGTFVYTPQAEVSPYYFNGHIPWSDEMWENESYRYDGDRDTLARVVDPGVYQYGNCGCKYNGTNVPSSGDTITSIKFAIWMGGDVIDSDVYARIFVGYDGTYSTSDAYPLVPCNDVYTNIARWAISPELIDDSEGPGAGNWTWPIIQTLGAKLWIYNYCNPFSIWHTYYLGKMSVIIETS